ncbi:MAG: hypothetical protein ACOCRX_08590 [Candidatus Woesearchaeota archaeon]
MSYKKIANYNFNVLKKQLKRNLTDEEYLILITKIYKNLLCKNPTSISDRIFDFFEIYYPELTLKISRIKLTKLLYEQKSFERQKLSNQWVSSDSIGVELNKYQMIYLNGLFEFLNPKLKWKKRNLQKFKEYLEIEIKKYVRLIFPKLSDYLNDDILCAFILEKSKNLKSLSSKSSNFIQMLGAEASFFNNYKPKHGLIYKHESVKNSNNKGKTARVLSNKISILVKEDYFKCN